ncbi:MAG TPA: HAMP domain-containing sensor histidine kinase [Bacteroidales bacterium]|nr:HAMP domain-containing sensor histidine kinase [Bacteroidales bacterium]
MNTKINETPQSNSASGPNQAELKENYLSLKLKEYEQLNHKLEERLKQRTARLTEILDSKTRFISVIAHDLRSPFTAIMGSLELLKHKLHENNDDSMEYYVDLAMHASSRALGMLDSLLSWTISQNMAKSFNPVSFNLSELIHDELEMINESARLKNILIYTDVPEDLAVEADQNMIRTIVRNFIGNAIKFTHRGGRVRVYAMRQTEIIEIGVSDNGIGISAEAQKKLFRFNSFQSTNGTEHEQGSGLGLLICKDFVDRHGGMIDVESEPGKGSTFKFHLPQCSHGSINKTL